MDNPHAPADALEYVECAIQLLSRMSGGHDGANPGFIFRDSRKADAGGQHPSLKQLRRKPMGLGRFAHHHRRDRRFADSGIEPGVAQTLLEVARILPELLNALGLLSRTSKAAIQAAVTAGGCEVENRNGRAR